ncbi:hypothetical protein NE848_09965 [Gramella jeungdoensis]|uniref:Uncharacterized protein n=1 Tax=Gramella jeungdoensis TaxID=708091 RepID=A0ABT0Z1U8_9FLAO|nr:hypothetical protein [Gramella jeungdoensis]MCM8569706.1 hypothetical protein [Gramella jeungdoensis]
MDQEDKMWITFLGKITRIVAFAFLILALLMILFSVLILVIEVFNFLGYNLHYLILIAFIGLFSVFILTDYFDSYLPKFDPLVKHIIGLFAFLIIGLLLFGDFSYRIFTDGIYCADVSIEDHYGDGESGNFLVEVEDGYVIKMYSNYNNRFYEKEFPEFDADLDSEGNASYYDENTNRFYYITLDSKDIPCTN